MAYQKQIEILFDVTHATISEHINNILNSGEVDKTSVGFSDKSSGGRKTKIYDLDMILSVGYRVNSKRGIQRPYPLKTPMFIQIADDLGL